MATFFFKDEFVECGAFKTTELKSIKDSDFTRINNNSYYAPLLTAYGASYDEGYILDDALASQISNNIKFTVSILPELDDGVHVEGTIYNWIISALRVNDLYGCMGLYYFRYKDTKVASGFVVDSSLDWNNAGGIPLDQFNNVTLIFIRLNNKIYPCKYTIDAKALYVMYPPDGTPLYNDIIVKSKDEIENPYYQGGTSGPGGGGGQFGKNEISDIIAGDLPLGSVEGDASATGMYTRYLCNSSYLDLIGDWVWDPNLGLSLIQTAIKPLYNDPAQAMISLVSFPFQLSGAVQGVTTRSQDMYFGHQPVLGAQFTAILSSACYIDWGTIDLQEYWGNFLDYYPHTKIEMYLPWGTGFVSIDPGQCLPGTLQVRTNIELARGSCVHNIINSAGCVIGSFAGQCGKQVPLIASDIAAKRAGLVTAAAGLIAGGAALASAGAVGTAAAGAAYNSFKPSGPLYIGKNGKPYYGAARMSRARSLQKGALSAAEAAFDEVSGEVRDGARPGINIASKSSIAALKTPISIQRNGGFTDGSAGMGIQYPYIILSRPEQNVPENYGQHFGYPSNIHSSLLFLKGYTEIGSVHLNGIPATAPELDELDAILKGGVIL